MKKHFFLLSMGLIAVFVMVGIALAASDPAVDWQVTAGGGAPATSGSIVLNDTLGQPIVGSSSGGAVALGAGYWYGWPIPTAVELAWFTATAQDGAIVLAWETASEIDLLGFHVYRQTAEGGLARLNATLLPVQTPGSLQGNRYEFVDETVAPGATYAYWLETVDARGARVRHGPASATLPLNRAYQIYLPVIRR